MSLTETKSCCGGAHSVFIFTIPKKINFNIEPFFTDVFGPLKISFKKTSVLKFDSSSYTITAIRKMNTIKITFKKSTSDDVLKLVEEVIIKYLGQ